MRLLLAVIVVTMVVWVPAWADPPVARDDYIDSTWQELESSGLIFPHSTYEENQQDARVARLQNGSIVVVWGDRSITEPDGQGIRAQIFDRFGRSVGNEFLVNTTIFAEQDTPAVTALSDGGFFIAWVDRSQTCSIGTDARGQRFDSNGIAIGSEVVLSCFAQFVRDININEVGPGQLMMSHLNAGVMPPIAPYGGNLSYRFFDLSGSPIPSTSGSLTGTSEPFEENHAAACSANRCVILGGYEASSGEISVSYVRGGIVDQEGNVVYSFFAPTLNPTARMYNRYPAAAGLTNGNFVIGWTATNGQDSIGYIQIIDNSGNVLGNAGIVGAVGAIALTAVDGGGFAAVWADPTDQTEPEYLPQIYVQYFANDGTATSEPIRLAKAGSRIDADVDATAFGSRGVFAAWEGGAVQNIGFEDESRSSIFAGFLSDIRPITADNTALLEPLENDADAAGDTLSIIQVDNNPSQNEPIILPSGSTVINRGSDLLFDPRTSAAAQGLLGNESLVEDISYMITDGSSTSSAIISIVIVRRQDIWHRLRRDRLEHRPRLVG